MKFYRQSTVALFAVLAVLLAALHSPGEMSVDSVMALYEGATGAAVGWGPTFVAALIAWLGGGVIGTSLLVAITCILMFGSFAVLLIDRSVRPIPNWQFVLALILALNPLFMFYVGIIWKDVVLATAATVAATLLLLATSRHGLRRYVLIGMAIVVSGILIPVRQQGILMAIPFAIAAAWLVSSAFPMVKPLKVVAFISVTLLVFMFSLGFYMLSASKVTPQPRGPVSVGVVTIQAYDIAGMIADSKPGDANKWSNASPEVQAEIRAHYSPERIDTIWDIKVIRDYLNEFSSEQFTSVWLHGIEHDPLTYLRSRLTAFAYLLGIHKINGCVPAYWGVYGLPSQVSALGLRNQMDARALVIGHTAQRLYATPIFRNWCYGLILLIGTLLAIFKTRREVRAVACCVAISGWLYFASFIPTTIACDFRYLYPVAALATVLLIYLLTHFPLRAQGRGGDA